MISADEGGFVEYWQPLEPFGMPKNVSKLWKYKSETDLYEFKKVLLLSIDTFSYAHSFLILIASLILG